MQSLKFLFLMNCVINSDEVRMWVYEETLTSGEKLTDVINQTNVRTTYAFHPHLALQ